MQLLCDVDTDVLPTAGAIRRILVLRTAQLREVRWAFGELTRRYPSARFGVLGSRMHGPDEFEGAERFDVHGRWVTPKTVRPLASRLARFNPDLVVFCLNSEWLVGYEPVSRVVQRLGAPVSVVGGYNRRWYRWDHTAFTQGPRWWRWLVGASAVLLYPIVAAYLLAKPSGPLYRETPPGVPPARRLVP